MIMEKKNYFVPSIKVMSVDFSKSFMAGSEIEKVGETGAENTPFL